MGASKAWQWPMTITLFFISGWRKKLEKHFKSPALKEWQKVKSPFYKLHESSALLWTTVTLITHTLESSIIIKGHCMQQSLFTVLSFKTAFLTRLREKLLILCTSPCSNYTLELNIMHINLAYHTSRGPEVVQFFY